ncbi:MAG TPA: hypothetical protein VIZ28_13745 [Chitinophagaceae bacterium]
MRYGEYPVDYSTGVPNIEIPLFQITSGKLNLPVSITYHASGIKVGDVASVAGLGWRLSAGGVLTRTVLGIPDDAGYGILNFPYLTKPQIDAAPQNGSEWNKLNLTSKGVYDAESDRYYYSVGDGLSGEFIYDNLLNLVQTTYSDNKIQKPASNVFQVVGVDGTKYIFDKCEYSQVNLDPPHISSWWLTKIISADNADEIEFEYETNTSTTVAFTQMQSLTLTQAPGADAISFTGSVTTSNPVLLKKITFRDGFITFDYLSDRKDMQANRLTVVSLFSNKDLSLVKKYQLGHSYFYSGLVDNKYNYRLKLDEISVYGGNGQYLNKYSFEYDQTHTMPPYIQDINYNSPVCYGIDFYGYYNGQTNNQHLIPDLPYPYPAIIRIPAFDYAKTCILQKIKYPTGGSTSFEYQINDPSGGTPYPIGGGLRVYRITSKTDETSTAIVKRYEYANNILPVGMDIYGWHTFQTQPIVYNVACTYIIPTYTTYLANPIFPYANFRGSPVLYQFVDEYTDGGTNNSIKASYVYGFENDVMVSVNSPRYQDQYYIERLWRKGQLNGVFYYKLTSNPPNSPVYTLVKSVQNTYSDFKVNTITTGTKVQRVHEILCGPCAGYCYDEYSDGTYAQWFYYFDTQVEVGVRKMAGEITTEYDGNGNSITSTRNTSYASPYHLFATNISSVNSKGENRSATLKYPHDFTGIAVYDAMISKNMISPVVEQLNYKNTSSFLQSTKTNYNYWYSNAWGVVNSNSLIVPQTVEEKILTNAAEVKIRYHSYDDKGNPLTVSKENDIKNSYIWGYNKQYPIAQVVNSEAKDIFHTSFEEGDGNSVAGDCKTGNKSKTNAFSQSLSNLTNGNYILSYWQKSGSTWSLQTNTAVVTNGTYTINLSGQIDEVRFYPEKAMMTTYTYAPLIGMTSQCDANNRITYYEYDSFGRLKLIKDQDGNILKTFEYKYQEQQ